jgi:PAS domain S-box-containing protein
MEQSVTLIGGGVLVALIVAFMMAILVRKIRENRAENTPGNAKYLASSLRDEKLKSEIILNTIEDGVMLLDEEKTIQLFNPGASQITGWATDEARGLDYHAVIKLVDEKDVPYEDRDSPLNRAYKEGVTVRDNKAILITRSEKRLYLSLSVSPLLDENKQVRASEGH